MHERPTSLFALLAALVLSAPFAVGCGGSKSTPTPGDTSGISGSKKLGELSDAEKRDFCGWTASLYGGYGKEVVCDSGSNLTMTIEGPASEAECLSEAKMLASTCAATVEQTESCLRSVSTCDEADDAAAENDCQALYSCYSVGP